MQRAKSNGKRPPDFDVLIVEGGEDDESREQKGFWIKIGDAWANRDQAGYSIVLSALPLTGRLVLHKRRPGHSAEDAQPDLVQKLIREALAEEVDEQRAASARLVELAAETAASAV